MSKKFPLKTVGLAVKMKSLAKVKQPKVARVELRVRGSLHGPEKPGWSVSGIEKLLGNVKTSSEKNNNNNQHHKNLLEALPSKHHPWEFC